MADPLAIVQARMGSRRFPGKMLVEFRGEPLVYWAWRAACDAFHHDNVIIALPNTLENMPLAEAIHSFGGRGYLWDGDENDVLGRFWACANYHRWHPDSVIVRVTPDDPFKDPALMLRVAAGERHPVELGGEAFTLRQLNYWHEHATEREHLSVLIGEAPPAPAGIWTIDTPEDLEAARAMFTMGVMA